MVTLTEKSADVATLVDDIASTLTGLTEWSDADTNVTNSGASDDPRDNGRVLVNDNTGTFLFFYVSSGDARTIEDNHSLTGVRVVHSTDWNTTDSLPAGQTTIDGCDANDVRDYAGAGRRNSFASTNNDSTNHWDNSAGMGLWVAATSDGARTSARSRSCVYFLSGRPDGVQIAAWNSSDATNGMASYFSFEHLNAKFWDDGEIPVAMVHRTNARDNTNQDEGMSAYGFMRFHMNRGADKGMVGSGTGGTCVEYGRWGVLNPDANDDTYFIGKAPIYMNAAQAAPVGYIEGAIPNDVQEGGAHGDIVTHETTDYRLMVQSGAGRSNAVAVGLKYE